MRIITKRRLETFAAKHPESRKSLQAWLDEATTAHWRNLADVRRIYPHADGVRVASGRIATIFNIRKNRFRLITAIHYDTEKVFIMRFLTHAEYDKQTWRRHL